MPLGGGGAEGGGGELLNFCSPIDCLLTQGILLCKITSCRVAAPS